MALGAQGCGMVYGAIAPVLQPAIVLADVEAPRTARRGLPVTIKLLATGINGCMTFPSAGAKVDEASRTVTFWGHLDAGSGLFPCSQAITTLSRDVTFTPASLGTYVLRATIWREGGDCSGWDGLAPAVTARPRDGVCEVDFRLDVTE